MILNDQNTSCPGGSFIVEVSDDYGSVPNPVTSDYVDKTLTAKIIDQVSGNSCWGLIHMEDKMGPNVTCPDTQRVACTYLSGFTGPAYVDACEGPVDAILLSESSVDLNCDTQYIRQVTRVYYAVDSKGNEAPQCTIVYLLERLDTSLIVCPPSYRLDQNTALSCDGTGWDSNGNDYPDPEETGVPSLGGINLYPIPDFYCNTGVFYTDIELPPVSCTRKIMRSWSIREWWCGQELEYNCIQIIEIRDTKAPTMTCNSYMQVTTNTYTAPSGSSYGEVTCGAHVLIPLPDADDNCSDNIKYDLTYPGGFISDYDGATGIVLPLGHNTVTIKAYDACYNSVECTMIVDVVDNTPPVTVCDEFTVVSLTTGGEAVVPATVFDDGSYDDCKMHCMLVRRMDNNTCDCNIPSFCGLDYLGTYGDKYYYLSDYDVPANIARKRAEAYGGTLAIFDDYDEEVWVRDEIRKSFADPFWIGLHNNGSGFLWDDLSALSYSNWDVWAPSYHADENCVIVNGNNKWDDVYCTNSYRYVVEISDVCGFSLNANFCCADVGTDQMVVFRTVDVFGNYNDCMVTVEIQDKIAPTIFCPPHTTVECDTAFDPNNLSGQFGEATVIDDCGATVSEEVLDELNQCGIGTLTRTFTATDDGGRTSTCQQVISFINSYPFNGANNIICPVDMTIEGCSDPNEYDPGVTGYPEYITGGCDLIAANYDDEVFTFNNENGDACFKILRHWEVIDWCSYDSQTGTFPIWTCHQVIKVINSVKPQIQGCDDEIMVCTYDAECNDGYVELKVTGSDDCTDTTNLVWRYAIYPYTQLGGPLHSSTPAFTGNGTGRTADASGTYPIGTHLIRWTYTDQCGNGVSCDQEFTIVNCKAPTPYCLNGLAVDLMGIDTDGDGQVDNGMVELWASDFDAGSSHPCTGEVFLSFSSDTSDRSKIFDCTTLGDQDVDIWVSIVGIDGSLVQSYCSTFINVQDNQNVCPDDGGTNGGMVAIEGNIITEMAENVEAVEVNLIGSPFEPQLTDASGSYAFPEMATGGVYTIDPAKTDNPLNGVTTLDLVVIQRHVLGMEILDSPFKYIAADINMDNSVSAIDILELRKLILGIYNDFPSNESWRFVDEGYEFIDPLNPLNESIPEVYNIEGLNSDMHVDFVGVKIGDINNSAQINGSDMDVESRNAKTVQVLTDNQVIREGELVNVPLSINLDEVIGFQFTLDFDPAVLELTGLSADHLGFTDEHVNMDQKDRGVVTVSWNDAKGRTLQDGHLMDLTFRALSKGQLSGAINLTSDLVRAEFYNDRKEILKPEFKLDPDSEGISIQFRLKQNMPNPFSGETLIGFSLPESGNATLTIHDINGKMIMTTRGYYAEGENSISLTSGQLDNSGVLYYTLTTNKYSATRKMVVLK